jgi:hypothetical protein
MGIVLYNRLPQYKKKLDTKHKFKNGVKKFLLQRVFYSVTNTYSPKINTNLLLCYYQLYQRFVVKQS